MILPNFIFAGAAKSGSSTLFEYIRQHPDICMSETKEPFFFDFNYENGISYYEKNFFHYQGEKIIGEATVWYMSWSSVPERIYKTIPDVKLLFVIRNPIDRAFSNYLMDLRGGHYTPRQTFGYVIRNEKRVTKLDRRIVSGGLYYQHLKGFEQYFEREKMLVILYDDLKRDIRAVERCVYQFLDIEPDFQAQVIKNYMVAPYLRNSELLISLSRHLPLFDFTWNKSRHFRSLFLDCKTTKRKLMDKEDRDYLYQLYKEPNKLLADYLKTDLCHWH